MPKLKCYSQCLEKDIDFSLLLYFSAIKYFPLRRWKHQDRRLLSVSRCQVCPGCRVWHVTTDATLSKSRNSKTFKYQFVHYRHKSKECLWMFFLPFITPVNLVIICFLGLHFKKCNDVYSRPIWCTEIIFILFYSSP